MATQQQFITNLYHGNESDEGTIKYYKVDVPRGTINSTFEPLNIGSVYPVVCVKRYNTFEWVRLNNLSASLWMRYRDSIGHYVPYLNACSNTLEEDKTDNKLVASLLATLTIEQRKKWLTENSEYKDKICVECGSFEPEIKKCIHHDCSGMCATCFDIKNKPGFENCACCLKKQEMTCPICQEDFATDKLVKSEQCSHHICWSCFGRSVKSSRPLSHCPLCRGIFCEKLVDLEDYDLDDIPGLEDDDDMPPLVEIEDDWSEHDEQFAMARAQEGMDFDAIITAIANGFVTTRDRGVV